MNTRPDTLHRRAARARKPAARAATRGTPTARVRAATKAPSVAGHGAANDPLWLIAIAMAVYFGLMALLIATD